MLFWENLLLCVFVCLFSSIHPVVPFTYENANVTWKVNPADSSLLTFSFQSPDQFRTRNVSIFIYENKIYRCWYFHHKMPLNYDTYTTFDVYFPCDGTFHIAIHPQSQYTDEYGHIVQPCLKYSWGITQRTTCPTYLRDIFISRKRLKKCDQLHRNDLCNIAKNKKITSQLKKRIKEGITTSVVESSKMESLDNSTSATHESNVTDETNVANSSLSNNPYVYGVQFNDGKAKGYVENSIRKFAFGFNDMLLVACLIVASCIGCALYLLLSRSKLYYSRINSAAIEMENGTQENGNSNRGSVSLSVEAEAEVGVLPLHAPASTLSVRMKNMKSF